MAVDYFHRLLVIGPRRDVETLQRRLGRTSSRRSGQRTSDEWIPFSFTSLYEIAPAARRVEREIPYDPYDISAWPAKSLDRGRAEIRYQLHTRNLELIEFLRPLARSFPRLTLRLMTHCLDSNSFESHRIRDDRIRSWFLPEKREEAHWERARRTFRLSGDDVYESDEAEYCAEEAMRAEALDHWEPRTRDSGRKRERRQWWNYPVVRDLEAERELALREIAEKLQPGRPKKSRKAKSIRRGGLPVRNTKNRRRR